MAVFALLALALSASKTLTASDGASYEIAVTYGASARIPAGSSLEVSELSGARYQSYYDRAVAELGRFERMRAFDIRCLAPDGSEIEPAAPVKVAFRLPGSGAARILHFLDGGGVTAPSPQKGGGGALNIETDSFSVYAVVETEPISAPLTVSEKFIDFTTDLFPAYLLEGEEPENDPVQEPGQNPGDQQGDDTGNDPGGQQGDDTGNDPGGQQGDDTGNDPGGQQGDDTEQNPGGQQGDDTGNDPGGQQGDDTGNDPDGQQGDDTGNDPDGQQGDNTGNDPGGQQGDNTEPNPGGQQGDDTEPNPEDQPGEVTIKADDKTKVEGAPDPTLTATVEGLSGEDTISYTLSREPGETVGTYTITPSGAEEKDNYHVTYQTGTLTIVHVEEALKKELTSLEGNWATWKIDVNSGEHALNDGKPLTLADTFTDGQSIDYSSVLVTEVVSTDPEEPAAERVTYDYRGNTGTYTIPDKTHVTITYRTLIAVQSVEVATFGNTAVLTKKDSGEQIAEVTLSKTETIYPSASEAADNAGVYMLRLFVYGNNNMREGISGAQFILLDENQRPMTRKKDPNKGDPVTFTTGENGYADIQIDEESGNAPIQKNTSYYLEMIQAPRGFKKDNTLYNFMITDNADYDSGGVRAYRNRDILKVRLQPEAPGLNVCMRFSGNYALRDDQKNAIAVILQKRTEEDGTWEEVERHTVSEFSYGSFTFGGGLEVGGHYRVIEENERPLDVPDIINLTTSYYRVIGPGSSDPLPEPPEFDVTDENKDSSFNIIISNEYEEHKLTITKMEKETGHRLPGAEFTVKKAANDAEVKTYTTDANGVLEISGGADYELDTLYYIVETKAPEGYLLPLVPQKVYFYFCNDSYLIPGILSSLPNGETAVNLWETYDSVTMDNQSKTRTIPVMQIWEGNTWPDNVDHVVVGLYQSVDGQTQPVKNEDETDKTVVLTKHAPYNNNAFKNLRTRDEQDRTITYSVKEEHIYTASGEDILESYVQQYGVSGSGVYIIRNKEATSLTVVKEWQDSDGIQITADETLAAQPDIKFDVYRSTQPIPEDIYGDGITNDKMTALVGGMQKVRDGERDGLSFGDSGGWQMTVKDLEKKDDTGQAYYYYVLETVPSFGDEVYELADGEITIRNQVLPTTTTLTVKKAKLVDDPREDAVNTDFGFTLALTKGTHPIRNYQVYNIEGSTLTTDWDGKVRFTLKPEHSIELTLPAGVTATVTEDTNPQYRETATAATDVTDLDAAENAFSYETKAKTPVTITFTNTLRVICKVTDAVGGDHPYESLQSALTYIRSKPAIFNGTATIQMLEDYSMPATDEFNIQEGENITLTTAETDKSMQFHFQTDRTENTGTAIITRAGEGGSLLVNAGTLTLENVCLDGAKDSFTATSDGGLVNNTGILNLKDGATLRNSKTSGKGGAVYSAGVVNMVDGAEITGNAAGSGSAVYLAGGKMNITGGRITENVDTSDGAVTVEDTESRINLSENPFIYDNKNAQGEQANLYIGADSDNILNVVKPGLADTAKIGVTAMETHREIAEQFGIAEYGTTANLDRFINDLYYYRAKLKEGTSTNIVWDGLTLTVKNVVAPLGANPNDTFTLTLSSASIRKSNYTIDGTLNYSVTAAKRTIPGKIVLRNLTNNDEIRISPLPVGDYTITETASNYATTRTGTNSETDEPINIDEDGNFPLEENSVLTVTHTRRLADVKLTKTLFDPLAGDNSVDFPFTLTLTEANGTPVSGFPLTDPLTKNTEGAVSTTLSPKHNEPVELSFRAPVGATLNITETSNPDYQITASGRTMPPEGEGVAIENTASGNVFAFPVTDDGASVTFSNVRKMATIELRKKLVGKVSTTEKFEFTVTLTNENGTNAANYPIYYVDAEHPEKNISTDENGTAVIPFDFPDSATSQSILLNVPEGTKLTVEEAEVKKNVDGTEQPIYDTKYFINGGDARSGLKAEIQRVTENDSSIVFTNTRKTQTVTVKNTVSGYSGNTEPFTFTATVADGEGYNSNGFTNGVQTFKLSTGQSKALTVPYGETLNVAETFIVGYETKINNTVTNATEFVVTKDETLNFTNTQLINLILDNKCSSEITDVSVYVSTSQKMYRVNDAGTGQEEVILKNRTAKVSVDAGKTATLEVEYTENQTYTVSGNTPAEGYLYTIVNEPAYHEDAKPAIMRVYNTGSFSVQGNLRYGPADSTVTFSEQPLVSYDVNGGAWTTEMDGYHDKNGNRKIYQYAVNVADKAPKAPVPPEPVYAASGVSFLGWTRDLSNPTPYYDFDNTPVTEPVTLYAVWKNVQSGQHIVTLKNGVNEDVDVTVIPDDDTLTQTNFTLKPGETKNRTVSNGAKLAVTWTGSAFSYSTEFPTVNNKTGTAGFTIDSVEQSGTIAFIDGVCKITDADGNTLYDANGKPAVYMKLSDAFTAYVSTLYTTAAHTQAATPAAVKMLVEEYPITANTAFPRKDVTVTTAGKNDADFPYVGVREHATLYRDSGFTNGLFTHQASATSVTLKNIILDGRDILNNINGSLIYLNYAGAQLNITEGAVLRNSNTNADYGGAIYVNNGTLNIDAGIFSNLRANRGGAIAATGTAVLNLKGTNGGTRFENCVAATEDGGAIYYSSSNNLTINGGTNRENPGIVFTSCVASSANGDGGAIYATGSFNISISGCAFTECSAKNNTGGSTTGFGGGGIGAKNVKSVTVSQCAFTACDTLRGGGAVMAYVKTNESISISDCSFDSCNCKAQGGALSVYQDNNGNTTSTTTLIITGCDFNNCSSGTENGSGGAIQSYVPCMEFTDSKFIDCWAGKEGGAVNNYFGNSIGEMWPTSYMKVTNCHFIRCRAEDRLKDNSERDKLIHYGGGINTKVVRAEVKDSYFEDCVSTLREGGALHFCGMNDGSQAIVEGSTFKNCEAKISGGALMASNESLTISNSKFYGCSALTDRGGAVCHNRNSRNDSTQNSTTITNCIFSPASESESGCNAVKGGAVWTRAKTVAITGCTIDKCTAANNGGGVYLAKNGNNPSNGTISGGTITGCQATNGSAVYQEDKATYSGATVTGNVATDANGGAIAGGTMYFEGLVTVKDNTYSGDSTVQHNVVLNVNNNTSIRTTEAGLDKNAVVRVYVADSNSAYANRGTEGKDFGTYGAENGNAYLENFLNDRDEMLYGYQKTDNKIYWGSYVCKITDADGNTLTRPNGKDAVYQSISLAFNDFTSVTGDAVYVKMLVESHCEKKIEAFPAAKVTLTTETYKGDEAVTGKYDGKHPYRGTEGTVCTLYPKDGQLFKLNNAETVFQLENITLDGRKNPATETEGAYRLIEAVNGSLIIDDGTTLQYGKADNGGAVYAADTARLTINSKTGSNVLFDRCVCNSGKTGGGAIYAKCGVTITREGNGVTRFTNCTAPRGGAVMVDKNDANVNVDIDGTEFSECHSEFEGGALYHNNNNKDAAYTKIQNSVFTDCYTLYDEHLSYGGAANSKAGTLTVESSQFNNCSAKSNGGAINHGSENNDRVKTTISDTTFTGCKTTGTNNDYGYGGSVYTQAIAVEITRCTVKDSTAYNYGGALYCFNSNNVSSATISGTSFDNCSVTRSDGIGGAIYSKGKALTIQDDEGGKNSVINACTAPQYSGAVYMETDKSTLNISGNTKISGCSADKGGAVYLKSGVKMYLAGSPEFTQNGYHATVNATEGACFYLAQESSLYLNEGSPKFSRNIITGKRVQNGSITDYALQDIYLAGYANDNQAQSIHIAGELTGDTIWVWPECDPHRLHSQQFAVVDYDSISDATLSKFRNALSDDDTKCSNGEYLAGVRGDTGKYIEGTNSKQVFSRAYWDKMYNISFKKTDGKTKEGLPGAGFSLYRDLDCTGDPIASTVSAQEETDTDAQGNFLAKGEVYFTTVPIGVYYMRETQTPDGFKENNTTYLFLVGTPALDSTTPIYQELWTNGPLQVNNAQNRVLRLTTIAGKGYGLFALDENNKAILNANLAFTSDGIGNIRNDYEASFMKVDRLGLALPDATFTLYTQTLDEDGNPATYENRYPKLTEWKRDADDAATSATSAGRNYNGRDSARGLVYFRELPKGTYYLKETEYPVRNGSDKQTFYVESDRVFRLEIKGDDGFTLSEWNADTKDYTESEKTSDNLYVVRNTEAVCKLTDEYNHLLYELGHDGVTLIPAVYATLEEGFEAVQRHVLRNANRDEVANDSLNPALKLMVLKDFTLTKPITYNSPRALTFTTAATYSTPQDKYHFVTTRTGDRALIAEIKRDYKETADNGALITVDEGASLTLEKIDLNGQKSSYSGRALRVVSGTLNVKSYTLIQNFKTEGDGGAVRMESGTTLNIAGDPRTDSTAQFSYNEAGNGGALSLSEACTVNISNAQFKNNTATGNGGAVDVPNIPVTLTNAVFTSNQATGNGGAVYVGSGGSMTLQGGSMTSNRATGNGGAVNVGSGGSLTLQGAGEITGNSANNGGAFNVESNGSLTLLQKTIKNNTATNKGGAIYAGENVNVTITGGTISGNSAGAENGGAVNVENATARLSFGGSPTVYNNKSGGKQKNVVLDVHSNEVNEVIRTTEGGLTGGTIGVYVAGDLFGDLFQNHGRQDTPFGTFGDTGHKKADVFQNDRNEHLYGTSKDGESEIYWIPFVGGLKVSKHVDSSLYEDLEATYTFTVTLYDPTINKEYGEGDTAMTFTPKDGTSVATFQLKDGESKTATNLPIDLLIDLKDSYTVEETETHGLTPTVTVKGVTTQGATRTGTINQGETSEVTFINKRKMPDNLDSIDFSFTKVDGFGKAIGDTVTDAEFTLYTDKDCTQRVQALDNEAQATHIGGGYYCFQNVPSGVYCMKEDKAPTGYAPTSDDNKYLVLVGADAWDSVSQETLSNVTRPEGDVDVAIFLLDGAGKVQILRDSAGNAVLKDGKVQPTPDINGSRSIMNVSEAESLVILRKIGETGNGDYESLAGVEFDILYWNKELFASGTSQPNGVFWVGKLPYGIYYLHEKNVPTDYAKLPGTTENWYRFTVTADGASAPEPLNAEPTVPPNAEPTAP
ncbi:MAG: hypothetical protein IKO14_08015 [Oscillibacter sp.]|nr:hypothetical protein [Oscillibacter sp.]